jgi:O-methyltransferase
VLRIDCDMYESTRDALIGLSPKLSQGGYAIVDDYGSYGACRKAVDHYRAQHAITEPMEHVDTQAVY